MPRKGYKDSFWLSYSDLMTSLFFIMLVLFIVCISKMKYDNLTLETGRNNANARKEQLERILQLDAQFEELSKSTSLQYIEEKKMFVAKDFIGIEIFNPNDEIIKPEYIKTVDKVGKSLEHVLKSLQKKNPDLSFQLIIEGNAAIPWQELQDKTFDPDNIAMYKLSYRRALALYQR